MTKKLIQQGAEAKIFLNEKENKVIKNRISKSYRLKELDDKIRKLRTRSEAKILGKSGKIIPVPKVLKTDEKEKNIEIGFINGKKLSEDLGSFSLGKQKEICQSIGKNIAKLHEADIIHGDLTTSNMILKEKRIYFIDFGLGYQNGRIEDKAVDLHLLKQALEAKHHQNWKELFDSVVEGYRDYFYSGNVLERMSVVEKRGRYRF